MDLDPTSRDVLIRTVIGEAGDEPPAGQAGVAHTVLNRLKSGEWGDSIPAIVYARGQFTSWNDRRKMQGISTRSPEYQRIGQIVDDAAAGRSADPTGGAVHFINPKERIREYGSLPDWAQGQPSATIGRHAFYAPEQDLLGAWPTGKSAAGAAAPVAAQSTEAGDDLLGAWPTTAKSTAPATAPTEAPPGVASQVNAGLTGFLRGIPVVGPKADELATAAAARLRSMTGGTSYQDELNTLRAATARDVAAFPGTHGVGEIAGTVEPMIAAGIAAPELMGLTGPMWQRVIAGAGSNALISGLDTAARGGSGQDIGQSAGLSGIVGGALGPVGYAASKLGGGLRNLLLGRVDPETAALADAARNAYGINVGPGQMSSNTLTRIADSVLQRIPFSGYAGRTAEQQAALNRGVSNAFGENVDKLTPQLVRSAKKRIGDAFDDVAQRTGNIAADAPFHQSFIDIAREARSVLPESEFEPIKNQLKDIFTSIDPASRTFSAETYQALTRKGAPLDRAIQSKDPNIRYYAGQIREALDDAMQRSAPPDAVQDLIEARSQWKALKTVEPLVKKAPTGDISPALLLGAVNKSYSRGGNALDELGRIGQRFLKEPASSNTAERLTIMHTLPRLALGAAGVGGAYYFDPEEWQRNALIAGLAFGGGRLASAGLRSNWLANSMIGGALNLPGRGYPTANLFARTAPLAQIPFRPADRLPGQ